MRRLTWRRQSAGPPCEAEPSHHEPGVFVTSVFLLLLLLLPFFLLPTIQCLILLEISFAELVSVMIEVTNYVEILV